MSETYRKTLIRFREILATIAVSRIAFVLIAVDIAFIAIHLAMLIDPGLLLMDVKRARIDHEGSYSERWEFVKLAIAAGALVMVDILSRRLLFGPIGAGVAYMAVDNRYGFHERAGHWLLPAHRNVGEAIVMLAFGMLLMTCFAWSWARSDPRRRAEAALLFASLAGLAGFAIVVDFLHVKLTAGDEPFGKALAIVEDGGELLMMSAVAAIAIGMATDRLKRRRPRGAAPSLSPGH